jgi:hypothetical protein
LVLFKKKKKFLINFHQKEKKKEKKRKGFFFLFFFLLTTLAGSQGFHGGTIEEIGVLNGKKLNLKKEAKSGVKLKKNRSLFGVPTSEQKTTQKIHTYNAFRFFVFLFLVSPLLFEKVCNGGEGEREGGKGEGREREDGKRGREGGREREGREGGK